MWNLFTVVDENDNILWYKSKADIDPQNEYYRVSALRLTNSQWDILIAQRAQTKSHNPGKRWPAVAWTVEEGESYADNITKETQEELWITGIDFKQWPKYKIAWERHYFWQWFFATVDRNISEFSIQKDEVEAVKWISPEELKKDVELHPEQYLKTMKKYINEFVK